MDHTCCIIGQRPQELIWRFNEEDPRCVKFKNLLRQQIEHMIVTYGVTRFLTGLERGAETYAAEIILDLKRNYPITLECVLANEDMRNDWLEEECDRFYDIIVRADKEYLLEGHASEDSMAKRNRFMVSRSHYVLVISDGKKGDVMEAGIYAYRNNRYVLTVNPQSFYSSPLISVLK